MIPRPICEGCKHNNGDDTCTAFPDGIPLKITLSELDHRLPVKGDNGIQFEARSPADAQFAAKRMSYPIRKLPSDVL